ncbi:Peptidyl-prolyl cis-trans isomerase D [Roseivivax sp. THAF40]|uniref:peptidylprolyl isomerase n=1 Tax=unclassified Roseivivax TaxID=2639302 RepID=UPI0012679DAE|nr:MULTISPECIES: peptidylprolyl isomerase [unclassified Roseivivax]QFS83217.1 Peptidyl-prolyl cis-trans isomerase D [Roseivivax sp. THAF197b]QFT46961.1 Peptidyl-prolyl cis-trans isomerase D [Roseivivax sp. THAF40]
MALKAGRISKFFLWILMGLLLVGLAGFGAVNLSGTARSVAAVGDQEVSVDAYARAVQQELRALQAQRGEAVTFAEARQAGLDTQVLSQLVLTRALDYEANRLGISVGDEMVAAELAQVGAFQGPNGQFSRDAYSFALDNAGMSESEFEEDLRNEISRTVFQGGVFSGLTMPAPYTDAIIEYAGERRDVTFAVLTGADLEVGIDAPTEDDLRSFYDENIDRYTIPETKRITYAWITPDMILDSVEVPEETLREAYEEQSARFNMPERRLVERLVFSDDTAAEAAAARIADGEITFEALVAERGLALSDTDLGAVSRDDLGDAAEAVFAAETGSVAGPAPTGLGPALFRVNAELAAVETSFEEAVPMLRDTLVLDRARRVIAAQAESYDNELAGGATLEELAESTDLTLGQIDWNRDSNDDIAAYPAFNSAARAAAEDDYPEIVELGDGGLFALRVDGIDAPAPASFEEVEAEVSAAWEQERTTAALLEQAEAHAEAISQGASFADRGLPDTELTGVERTAVPERLPRNAVADAFDAESGSAIAVAGPDRVAVIRVDAITPADPESEDAVALATRLSEQAEAALADDLFRALSADIQSRAGVTVNQDALNAVNSSLQ